MFSFLYCLYVKTPYSTGDAKLHIYFGQYFKENNFEIPSTCIGSWYGEEQNLPWVAHEWLSEILMSYISLVMEYVFSSESYMQIFSIFACLLLLISIIVFHNNRFHILNKNREESRFIGFFFFIFLIAYSLTPHIGFKPSFFGYVCFLFEMIILYGSYCNRTILSIKEIFLLFVVSAFWSNLHGGSSVLAYAIPLGFFVLSFGLSSKNFSRTITELFQFDANIEILLKNKTKYAILTVTTVLGTICNPYGTHILEYPFKNMMDYDIMLQYINEWHPFQITDSTHLIALLPIFSISLFFFLLNTKNKKLDVVEFSFLCCFFLMSMKSVRFSIYFVLFFALLYHPTMFPFIKYKVKDTYDWKRYTCKIGCMAFAVLFSLTNFYGGFTIEQTKLEDNEKLRKIIIDEHPKRVFQWLMGGNELLTDYGIKPNTIKLSQNLP